MATASSSLCHDAPQHRPTGGPADHLGSVDELTAAVERLTAQLTALQDELANTTQTLEADQRALRAERDILALKVKALTQQLWGRTSERLMAHGDAASEQITMEIRTDPTAAPAVSVGDTGDDQRAGLTAEADTPAKDDLAPRRVTPTQRGTPRSTGWRKSIDTATLERVVIPLDDPDAEQLRCPITGTPMRVVFVEEKELLARRPAQFYLKVLRRNVFGSAAKSTLRATEWPMCALTKSQMDASVVADIAVARYVDHMPYYRLEQRFKRYGIALPRSSQVALMDALDRFLQPIIAEVKRQVITGAYIHLDATPVDVMDRHRPGKTREATLWAYRTNHRSDGNLVWFDFAESKSPSSPDRVLTASNFRGILQTDGAAGFDQIGIRAQILHVGCMAHCRRYFFKAYELSQRKDLRARSYLDLLNALFRIERRATSFALSTPQRAHVRTRYSLPLWRTLLEQATRDVLENTMLPQSLLRKAIHYLLGQRAPLERCLTTLGSRLDNNLVENSIRPVKLGSKNWLFCGSMEAGPRLANLYTVLENCRMAGIDPEAYLIDIIATLQTHKANRISELLPPAWKARQQAQLTQSASSAA